MQYSKQVNQQLRMLSRLEKAKAMAFKLFYMPRAPIYAYIKKSIDAEILVSLDTLNRLCDHDVPEKESEQIERVAGDINYRVNELLVKTAGLQDSFFGIGEIELTNTDVAKKCWDSLSAEIMTIRAEIVDIIPIDNLQDFVDKNMDKVKSHAKPKGNQTDDQHTDRGEHS